MAKYVEFIIDSKMVTGYEGETEWLKLFDDKKKLREKIEERRGIYLFRVDPPDLNIKIYNRLKIYSGQKGDSPNVYSQITHIGGMLPKSVRTKRNDIFKRAVEDYHGVKNRNVDAPSKYSEQRLEKSRIMQEFSENFYVKIYYTDSDEAEQNLLNQHIKKIGYNPPWDL
jgi:hypothetical protein